MGNVGWWGSPSITRGEFCPPTYRPRSSSGYVGRMDGQLRRLKHDHWRGTLAGYQVDVFRLTGQWHFSVSTVESVANTRICALAASRDEAARKARAWIEGQNPVGPVEFDPPLT